MEITEESKIGKIIGLFVWNGELHPDHILKWGQVIRPKPGYENKIEVVLY